MMDPHAVTREVMREFLPLARVAFYALAAVANLLFLRGIYLKVRRYRRGRAAPGVLARPGRRFLDMLAAAGGPGNRLFGGDRYAGWAHTLILWGFLAELAGTTILALEHDLLAQVGVHFFYGTFYLVYSLVLDVLGVALLAGLAMMVYRRLWARPARLDYARADGGAGEERRPWGREDWAFLGLLLVITLTGFVTEGFRLLADARPAYERAWSPVGWLTADLLSLLGVTQPLADAVHRNSWWLHALLALTFGAWLVYTKGAHIVLAWVSLFTRDPLAGRRLPAPPPADGYVGYRSLEDFTWRELVSLDACTRCGRCHESCPARASGAPLSPRDLVLDLRLWAERTALPVPASASLSAQAGAAGDGGAAVAEARGAAPASGASPAGAGAAAAPSVAGEVIAGDTLWSCTTCRACVQRCPAGVEHLPMIVQMRRRLVDLGELDGNLQDTLMKLQRQGNSFGQSDRLRARWTQGLEFKVKDVRREPAEYLWFVGDYASFDPRAQEVTRAAARLFQRAGLDFGIMHEGERNAGNDVRRVGEEGLFELLVEHNLKWLGKSQFQAVLTTDPHSYNTLKNEYPDYGLRVPVFHHTEILDRLLAEGRLRPARRLGVRVTYHDPCYLGRYNGVFDAPRRVLAAVGATLVEMPRHREHSFCCGAGGGRIWMGDSLYKSKPAEERVREAAALGVEVFAVACPKDMAMYQDAVKTAGLEGKLTVKDVAQLVEEVL